MAEVTERVHRPRCGAFKHVTAQEFYVCWRRRGHSGAHVNREKTVRWTA